MPSPFPGMDPYLETPQLWPDVHHEIISQIRGALNPVLQPHYVARIELRVYVSDEDDPGLEVIIPDVRVEEVPKRRGAKRPRRIDKITFSEREQLATHEPRKIGPVHQSDREENIENARSDGCCDDDHE